MDQDVTRIFDILGRCIQNFNRNDALGGKNEHGNWYTYSTQEYYNYSRYFALGLLAMDMERDAKIVTVCNNRPEWNFADMGVAMAGHIHLPIYPTISIEEYKHILSHAEPRILIAGDKKIYQKLKVFIDEIPSIKKMYCFDKIDGIPCYDEIIQSGRENEERFSSMLDKIMDSITPDEVVTLIYTSGTTGVPKGVMLTHENLCSNFKAHSEKQDLGAEHRALSFLPLCHVYERSMNYHFQYKGMGVYYVANLGQIVSAIREVKPHMFNSVPRLMERVYDGFISKGNELKGIKKTIYFQAVHFTRHFDYGKKLTGIKKILFHFFDNLVYSKWREALGNNIQYIVSGGAALQPRILKVFGMTGINALEGYGLTETSPVIAVNDPVKKKMKLGTVGPVLEGVQVKIADDGEILCRGPLIMKGYYKDPELTAQVIDEEGWFHTGDIGILEDGIYLKITDRKKEIFKMSGGKYISPQMIENKLKESFFVEQAMVIGENEKFASALISPNFDYLHDWCAERRIRYRDNAELIRLKEVLHMYSKEVEIINKTLGQHEEIKRFRLVEEEWTPQSGDLSPTLKLKRQLLFTKYKDIIDDIYSVSKQESTTIFPKPKINLRFDLNGISKKIKKLKW